MYEMHVEGMNCGGCVRGVTKSVQSVDSNVKVDVDLNSKRVRVDTKASLEAVTSTISDAGYPVTASAEV